MDGLFVIVVAFISIQITCGEMLHWRSSAGTNSTEMFGKRDTFRAAAYEHAVMYPDDPETPRTRAEALDWMNKNLDVYQKQAHLASEQGAFIIVFPENGLMGFDQTRESAKSYLERVPDPNEMAWNPCEEPDRFPHTEVQKRLSCIAKKFGIYLIANIGEILDSDCSVDGRFQYNTNVVYDSDGNLIIRYRKYNLFEEPQYDRPPRPEIAYFDTSVGRFGIITCADMFYKSPAVDLVELYSVKHILVPAAWDNELPYALAFEVQQGFSVANRVNLLAANIQLLRYLLGGSGIYSTPELTKYVLNTKTDTGTLLVAEVPMEQHDVSRNNTTPWSQAQPIIVETKEKTNRPEPTFYNTTQWSQAQPIIVETKEITNRSEPTFISNMRGDDFVFVALSGNEGNAQVCFDEFCCYLDYEFRDRDPHEVYALGAWQGLHTYLLNISTQVCTVVRCETKARQSCGKAVPTASSTFDRFILRGTFQAEKVYPFVITVENFQFYLAVKDWEYKYGEIISKNGFQRPLLSTLLYGRYFSKDPPV